MPHNTDDKPIAVLSVLCDPKRIQTIRIECARNHKWTERIPREIHNSDLIVRMTCPQCGEAYLLRNHQMIREDKLHDRPERLETNCVVPFGDHIKFDA